MTKELDWEKVATSLEKSAEDARSEKNRVGGASNGIFYSGLLAAEWVFSRFASAIRAGLE